MARKSKTPTVTPSAEKIDEAQPLVSAAASTERQHSWVDKIRLKLGYFGAKAALRIVSVILLLIMALFIYLLVIFTAVSIIPNIAAFIQQGTGIGIDLRLDVVIAGWLLPTVFVVGMVMVAEVAAFRALWRFTTGIIKKMGVALFRIDEEERAAAAVSATTKTKR